ncbi:hypothetical protein ACLB1O_16500 [Escherichia coli]
MLRLRRVSPGGTPPVKGQQLNASIIAQTRLTSTEEFGKSC